MLLGHDDDGTHHVAVLMLQDVAVIHEASRVGSEAQSDVEYLVGVEPDGVLEPQFVGLELVRHGVGSGRAEVHLGGGVGIGDAAGRNDAGDAKTGEGLELHEVDVERVQQTRQRSDDNRRCGNENEGALQTTAEVLCPTLVARRPGRKPQGSERPSAVSPLPLAS